MARNPRMLFRNVDGSPVPAKPTDARGTPLASDGRILLSVDQAAAHFGADRLALVVLFYRVMLPTLGAEQLAAMIAEEEGTD